MAEKDNLFLSSYWQDINTEVNAEGVTARRKADGYRKMLLLLGKLKSNEKVSNDLFIALQTMIYRKYAAVVDSMKDGEGMNNYADTVLQIVSGLRNQSNLWKSKLHINQTESDPSLMQEILGKAKDADQTPNLFLKYSQSITNTTATEGNTFSGTCVPKGEHMKVTQKNVPGKETCFTNKGVDVGPMLVEEESHPRLGKRNLKDIESCGAASGHYRTTQPCFSKNANVLKSPNNVQQNNAVRQNGADWKSRQPNGPGFPSAIIKRKYGGYMEHSSKQAKLEPSDSKTSEQNRILRDEFENEGIDDRNANQNKRWASYDKRKLSKGLAHGRFEESNIPINVEEESHDSEHCEAANSNVFMTARDQLIIDQKTKNRAKNFSSDNRSIQQSHYGVTKKSLGTRRGASSKFTPPVMNKQQNGSTSNNGFASTERKNNSTRSSAPGNDVDERLKNVDPRMIEMIENEIMDHGPPITWDDIAGLEFAKNTIQEIVIWPMLRPDIFTGLRGPPKGLLLFGPPGTGKTLIGKCIASQSHATFFSISASSLTSKWIGEGEKMVRALFSVARCQEPAVIFIDEIDSLLSQRSDGEHEATRRIKTEFLIQLDGATTKAEERILVVGATNRPQELDEAARRRLVKRLYIALPEAEARRQIVSNLMKEQMCSLDENDLNLIMENSLGYSGADMANLCREAALGPIRSINLKDIRYIKTDEVRPIIYKDFENAFRNIRPSVSQKDLELYTEWNKLYGSGCCI